MSEPARKRRDRRLPPQWRQHQPQPTTYDTPPSLNSDTHFTANSEPVGVSQSANSYSASSHALSYQNVSPAFPIENPFLPFPHSYPGIFIPEPSGAELLLAHVGNVPLPPSFEGNVQTQFNASGDIGQSVPLTAVSEPWHNLHGVSGAPLTTPAPDYDPDVSFFTLPPEDIWRDTSLYRLDGGMYLKPRVVVSTADVRSRKRGSCSL
jgi:hypothetical protein